MLRHFFILSALVGISAFDIKTLEIPRFYLVLLLFLKPNNYLYALIPWIIYLPFLFLARKLPIGMGDIKLFSVLGFAIGSEILKVFAYSSIASGIVAAIMLLSHKASRQDPIPYAPFIAIGYLLSLVLQ